MRQPPGSTRTDPLFPYTTLFRSRVVHRVDAGVVGLEFDHAVRLPDRGLALLAQLALHRPDERREDVQDQRPALGNQFRELRVDAGIHHDWPDPHRLTLGADAVGGLRSEEHTSELQSLMSNSYAVFCFKKKK